MTRLLGFSFLAVFAYALVGVYPVQWALREMAKEYMKSFIQQGGPCDGSVTSLSFPLANGEVTDPRFAWDGDDEFSFDGAMYDVLSREVKNGAITFHCIGDQKETSLLAISKTIDQVGGSDRSMQQNSKTLIKFISERYVCDEMFAFNMFSSSDLCTWPAPLAQVNAGYEPHFAPPPRG